MSLCNYRCFKGPNFRCLCESDYFRYGNQVFLGGQNYSQVFFRGNIFFEVLPPPPVGLPAESPPWGVAMVGGHTTCTILMSFYYTEDTRQTKSFSDNKAIMNLNTGFY